MNDSDSKCGSSGSCDRKKPSHVRRLNFGQSILTLHAVRQFHGQKDGMLTLDRNVATIPCTSKDDFVRKWIETHRNLESGTSSSPILGLAGTKRALKSPIFHERCKRVRDKEDRLTDQNGNHRSSNANEKKENVRRNLFQNDFSLSPVLAEKFYSKRNNCERKALHRIENQNVSPILDRNNLRNRKSKEDIVCSQKRRALIRKLEEQLKNDDEKDDSKISDHSSKSISESEIEESPVDAESVEKIESEIESVQEEDPSVRIEDADTQDLPEISSTCSNKDSDRTFFSGADEIVNRIRCASQRISQISSQPEETKSACTELIVSTGTSPQRTQSNPFQINLEDLGKKRRKPKKGSLSEKLQSLINRQTSFLRMWRHRIKQMAKDKTVLPYVSVRVKEHATSFSRQFFVGIVTEDSFSLLPSLDPPVPRTIKIMMIPEIVGKIELKVGATVRIFPPWDTLDDRELTVNVTYINASANVERSLPIKHDNETNDERSVVKEFDCLCIRTGKMHQSCADRLGKINVIEQLFCVDK